MNTSLDELRDSYGKYFLANNPDYQWTDYQQNKIIPALEAVARGELTRLMIFMPPGFGKTDLATRNFVPWYLGHFPKKNVMVCSYAASLASDDFGGRIKERLETTLHQLIFPDSQLSQDSHGKNQFRTIKGGTFYSVGFGGAMAGKRVDLMVLDDLIKNDDEANSEVIQEKLFQTYGSVTKGRMRPNGAIVFCITRWRLRDIAGRILELEGRVENGGDWTVITLKAQNDDGSYLWDHYPKSHYEQAKKFEEAWQSLWQQDPQGSKSLWFKRDWLEFYDVCPPRDKFNNYMLCDPAMGIGKKSDATVIQVWAAGPDENYILVDWVNDRLDPGERARIIIAMLKRWQPKQFIYEEIGLNSDTYFIRKMLKDDNHPPRFYPIPVGRSGPRHLMSKSLRIQELKPIFFDHKIILPRKFWYTNSEGRRIDLTARFIESEFSVYKGEGSVRHDDDLDCMSRIREPELVWRFHKQVEEKIEKPTRNRTQGVSWESYW
jgi:hypothetical protein